MALAWTKHWSPSDEGRTLKSVDLRNLQDDIDAYFIVNPSYGVVFTSTDQTIAGVKTFTSAPVVPDGSFSDAKLAQIVTAGKIATTALPTVPIASGGTGATTAQAAIDALTNVSSATNEYVLTKDTATGQAMYKLPRSFDYAAASTWLLYSLDTERNNFTYSGVFKKVKSVALARGGAFRISYDFRVDPSGPAYANLYKNGVAVGTQRTATSSSFTTYTEDITGFQAGDTIELWIRRDSHDCSARNFRVYTSTPELNTLVRDADA